MSKGHLKRLVRDDAGQDLIEYALLAASISTAVIGAVTAVGGGVLNLWASVLGKMP